MEYARDLNCTDLVFPRADKLLLPTLHRVLESPSSFELSLRMLFEKVHYDRAARGNPALTSYERRLVLEGTASGHLANFGLLVAPFDARRFCTEDVPLVYDYVLDECAQIEPRTDRKAEVLVIGELSSRKRVGEILAVADSFAAKCGLSLKLAGWPEEDLLRAARHASAAVKTDFRYIDQNGFAEYLADTSVVLTLFDGRFQPSGVVINAWACGTPIVAAGNEVVRTMLEHTYAGKYSSPHLDQVADSVGEVLRHESSYNNALAAREFLIDQASGDAYARALVGN